MLIIDLLEDLEGQKAKRGEFILNTYSSKFEPLPGYDDIKKLIDKLGEIDPTKNGAYMQWLAKLLIKNPSDNKTEDLARAADDIKTFETNKSKLEKKDINAYKSFQDLYDTVKQFYVKKKKTADERKEEREEAKLAEVKDQITNVYKGSEGWIKIPTTKKAAQFLGQGTRWCTSAASNNMFDHYTNSDSLFVVYDKSKKARFQVHIDSGAFADEADKHLGMENIPEWARKPIVAWYKKNAGSASIKQAINLHKLDGTGIKSEHDDLLDMMKQYGVI